MSLLTVSETHGTRLLSCSPHPAELLGQHTLEMGGEGSKRAKPPDREEQLLLNIFFTVPGLNAPEHSCALFFTLVPSISPVLLELQPR